jgi:hypothetical protein
MALARAGTAATPARKSSPADQSNSRNMPTPERIKMISVQVTGLYRNPHMFSPQFITTIRGCPQPSQWTGSSFAFLEYLGDALNHLRITVPDVVARQLWRNSRFARAMVMAMR